MKEKHIDEERSLCLDCGLCCDGTLFGEVKLSKDDSTLPLKAVGIQIVDKNGKKSFQQGCSAYHENRCLVYEDRPSSCQKFRCNLLSKYGDGNISREDAIKKIRRVHEIKNRLWTEIEKKMPDANYPSVLALLNSLPRNEKLSNEPALLDKWGTILLVLSGLQDRLRSDFWAEGFTQIRRPK